MICTSALAVSLFSNINVKLTVTLLTASPPTLVYPTYYLCNFLNLLDLIKTIQNQK
jgi:hypothetical protein